MRIRERSTTEREIDAAIARGETHTFEVKASAVSPSDVALHVTAFANADGGTLVVGIKDTRVGQGRARIDPFPAIESANPIVLALRNIDPSLDDLTLDFAWLPSTMGKGVLLVISVGPSLRAHRSGNNATYLRTGAQSVKLKPDEKKELEKRKLRLRWRTWGIRGGLLAFGIAALGCMAFFGLAEGSRPEVVIEPIMDEPAANQNGTLYVLTINVGESRNTGIVDLVGSIDLPLPLEGILSAESAGCEDFGATQFSNRVVNERGEYENRLANRVQFRAKRCAPLARPQVTLLMQIGHPLGFGAPIDQKATYEASYGWELPLIGLRAPSRNRVSGTIKPPSYFQRQAIHIPTRNYPASVSTAPYYDLDTGTGSYRSFINKADYAEIRQRAEKKSPLAAILTPKIDSHIAIKNGDELIGDVRWSLCSGPIEASGPLPDIDLDGGFSHVAFSLEWANCAATLKYGLVQQDGERFVYDPDLFVSVSGTRDRGTQ